MSGYEIVSRHYLRRRARTAERRRETSEPRFQFRVRRATRGPHRWYVERRVREIPRF